ncbi:hypothetical protein ACF06X_12230 [Streptomyces sp. NPDC015346]|uniref:hypothetical protein n=1 Tax=Streptomyces sp. NPDC015346 TaxID=3364954 RepID=UPI003702861B
MRDHPRHPHHPRPLETEVPVPEVWTGRATNRAQWLLAIAGAAFVALGIEIAVAAPWRSGIVALLMSVIGCVAVGLLMLFGTLAFVHVAVKVDDRALEVRCGHIGLPRRRIPLSQVTGVDIAAKVTPRHWGGWGYRWLPEKGTGVIVRRGEALVLTLVDGRTFTITVDDADSAVRVIRDRLSRATPEPPPAPPTPPTPPVPPIAPTGPTSA